MKTEVDQLGIKYIADTVPKLCNTTAGITDRVRCFNTIKGDLAIAIQKTGNDIVNVCTMCLMNMTRPIFAKYDNNVAEMIGNASTIAKEVNGTLFQYCKLDKIVNLTDLTAAWKRPLTDGLRQTMNSSQAFQQALVQNGLARLYEEQQVSERHSTIMKVVGGGGFVILAVLGVVVAKRRYTRVTGQMLSPDKRFSRELISEETDLLPVIDTNLPESRHV